jgi:hypothetical protein
MKPEPLKQQSTTLVTENNSIIEIISWTFCFIRLGAEKLQVEIQKLAACETGVCRINTIFGCFKYC